MRYLQLCSLLLALIACTSHTPEINVACEITHQNNYLLKWETLPRLKGEVKIYQSTHPEQFDTDSEPMAIVDIQAGYIELSETDLSDRNYFLLRFNNRYDHIVGPRGEHLKHIQNFRDLGGYKNVDGNQIRWGKIFRSGQFSDSCLTDTEIARINNMGIKTLIDLRDEENRKPIHPDLQFENTFALPGAIHYQQSYAASIKNETMYPGNAKVHMQDIYKNMILGSASSLKVMFDKLLVKENYPVVLSCVNGKDYTGFAVSMLLHALEIPSDIIIEDYELSNNYFDKRCTPIQVDTCCEEVQEALSLILSADSRFLSYAHECIRKQYGSIDNYLEQELALTPEKRNQLKQTLLY